MKTRNLNGEWAITPLEPEKVNGAPLVPLGALYTPTTLDTIERPPFPPSTTGCPLPGVWLINLLFAVQISYKINKLRLLPSIEWRRNELWERGSHETVGGLFARHAAEAAIWLLATRKERHQTHGLKGDATLMGKPYRRDHRAHKGQIWHRCAREQTLQRWQSLNKKLKQLLGVRVPV